MDRIASVYIATSLDGFIAREDGDIDWLNAANEVVSEGEDCGFFAFFDSVDCLVMGRNSFEKVLSFGQWFYGEKPVIVLSRNEVEIPGNLSKSVSWSSESPKTLSKRLVREGVKKVYIDGGITIQRFLQEGLVRDMTVTVIPLLLGSGIPLFGKLEKEIQLNHLSTKAYDFGFVQSTYEVKV
jgi:dihydrofolate reductase